MCACLVQNIMSSAILGNHPKPYRIINSHKQNKHFELVHEGDFISHFNIDCITPKANTKYIGKNALKNKTMSAWLVQESRIVDTADTARHETKSYGAEVYL